MKNSSIYNPTYTPDDNDGYVERLLGIRTSNGGGLSLDVSGKYTSVRHELARESGKLTAGEAAKKISKELKLKVSAKEVVSAYETLNGCEPEWHHAGFYRNSRGKSTMGRTFFFTKEEVDALIAGWSNLAVIQMQKDQKAAAEAARLQAEKEAHESAGNGYMRWQRVSINRFGKLGYRLICDHCGYQAEAYQYHPGDAHYCEK
jgi:hypothetical protein